MDSRMNLQIANEHIADLHRAAAASRQIVNVANDADEAPVIALRLAGEDEVDELAELAALDSKRPLRGMSLVALVDGKLVAAVSLDDGRMIANPLVRSAEAQTLLRTRADQLAFRKPRPRRRFRLRFA